MLPFTKFLNNSIIIATLITNYSASCNLLNSITRTEQAIGFFEYFWDSFPFGVGYNTKDIPSGVGENGIDCGYLNTMYITGLSMVILLFVFTAFPIYKCWFRKNSIEQIVVIARATTWTIILLSSATTGFEIEFIYFIICAGRCAGLVEKEKLKRNDT